MDNYINKSLQQFLIVDADAQAHPLERWLMLLARKHQPEISINTNCKEVNSSDTYKKTIITKDNKYNEQSEPQTAKTAWLRLFHIAKSHISKHQPLFTFLNKRFTGLQKMQYTWDKLCQTK